MNRWDKKISDIVLLLLTIGISMLYISLIFNSNIWTDEAFTIELVSENSVRNIIMGTANDVHPPLYYLLVKVFISIFGSSIQAFKIVSIIPMTLTMLLSYIYIAPWFGRRTAILFVLFLNAIPCVMEYGVQIRMYSWTIFFITLAALSAYGVYRAETPKHWILLSISALFACYTHNFAMISAVFIYAILGLMLVIKNKRFPYKWLLSGVFVGVCYIPWLVVLFIQTRNRVDNYWIEEITVETVLGYISDIFSSRIPFTTEIFTLLCAVSLLLCITYIKRVREKALYAIYLYAIPFLTAFTGIMVSIYVTPFFIARYLLPCMGLLALALAITFGREKKVPYVFLSLFLVSMIANSYYMNYEKEYNSTHTEELLAYMNHNLGEKDIILYNYEIYGFIYECYFDEEQLCFLGEMDFSSDYDTIWYFDSCVSPWLSETTLIEHGLKKEYIATLGIEQNDFILYKISR
ncbi:MAG: glycosyltransferase family 39 protein [Lachnospiraceae bacterium]|nr:glycosyltransferase family 39 protein [Lachnospiraceae bacterium]